MPDRKISALSFTTDFRATKEIPASHQTDVSNEKWPVSAIGGMSYRSTTATTTLTASDRASLIHYTSGNVSCALTAATGLGAGWWCEIHNTSTTPGETITFAPNGSETINGATSLGAGPGSQIKIICTGSAFRLTGDLIFDSGFATWAISQTTTMTHNLGKAPSKVDLIYFALATEANWPPGTELRLEYSERNANLGIGIACDTTNIYMVQGTAVPAVANQTTFVLTNLTATNWNRRIRAWL